MFRDLKPNLFHKNECQEHTDKVMDVLGKYPYVVNTDQTKLPAQEGVFCSIRISGDGQLLPRAAEKSCVKTQL